VHNSAKLLSLIIGEAHNPADFLLPFCYHVTELCKRYVISDVRGICFMELCSVGILNNIHADNSELTVHF
jgi:hypothetical protein